MQRVACTISTPQGVIQISQSRQEIILVVSLTSSAVRRNLSYHSSQVFQFSARLIQFFRLSFSYLAISPLVAFSLDCCPSFSCASRPDVLFGEPTNILPSHLVGIIGMGRIGFEIARRAHGFDCPILYYN